jgi:molybdate transport system regulatory protein
MNKFSGTIQAIQTHGSLSQLEIETGGLMLCTIIIETPETADYLKTGNTIQLIFKETEVILSKSMDSLLSVENQIPGNILEIQKGSLLYRVRLETKAGIITSVITKRSGDKLNFSEGDEVVAMIKNNEIMLSR